MCSLLLWHFDVIFTKWKCFLLSLNFIDFICNSLMYKTCIFHITWLIEENKYIFIIIVGFIWYMIKLFNYARPYFYHVSIDFLLFIIFENFVEWILLAIGIIFKRFITRYNIWKLFLCNASHYFHLVKYFIWW